MIGKYIKLRVFLVGLAFIVLFAMIGAKAVHLQVYRSPWLAQKASSQYEKSLKSSGKRGTVYDRNLREMAVTIDVTSIGARTSKIKNPQKASRALAKILKSDRRYILKKLKSKGPFVWIKRQASPKETAAVKSLNSNFPMMAFCRDQPASIRFSKTHWARCSMKSKKQNATTAVATSS
jgi:cell division protein FtsI (penicillin-binding protein 3)